MTYYTAVTSHPAEPTWWEDDPYPIFVDQNKFIEWFNMFGNTCLYGAAYNITENGRKIIHYYKPTLMLELLPEKT